MMGLKKIGAFMVVIGVIDVIVSYTGWIAMTSTWKFLLASLGALAIGYGWRMIDDR